MNRRFYLIPIIFLLSACIHEGIFDDANIKTFDHFTAFVEESEMTKAYMEDSGAVKWNVGDCIGVYSDTQAPVPYHRGEDGVFRGEPVSGTTFYAFYPYSEIEYDADTPMVLTSLYNGVMAMVAKSSSNKLLFKQAGGMLCFTIRCDHLTDVSFGLRSNNEEPIGIGTIDMTADTPVISGKENIYQSAAFRKQTEEGLVLYVPMPVGTLERGFKIDVAGYDESTESMLSFNKATRKEISITRGQVLFFSLVNLDAELEEQQKAIERERDALVALYDALDGDHWVNNTNWCSDKPVSEWYGIMVNPFSGRVTDINLRGNRLRGVLPDVLAPFTELETLDLSAGSFPISKDDNTLNIITGEIPSSIGELTSLERLILSGNSFSGSLPETMRKLLSLKGLHIEGAWNAEKCELEGYEYLSGPIPNWIGELENLENLNFQCQGFSGVVPPSLSSLKLMGLLLNNNSLSGPLPELQDYSMLSSLALNGNDFTGSIPASYSALLDLSINLLWIQNNKLSGPLPESILTHPLFSERAYDFVPDQKPGFGITLDKIPACRHKFETLDGNTLILGEQYAKADYTMIVRWAEWCTFSRAFLPTAISLSEQYKEKGLQTIWAYGGGVKSERIAYMESIGLDQLGPHIIECHDSGTFNTETDYAVWKSWKGYATPYVEVVDKEGNIVFIDDEEGYFTSIPYAKKRDRLEVFLSNLLGGEFYQSTDYSADGEVHTLQTATTGSGIDLIFMGDAFTDKMVEDGTYEQAMIKVMDAFFSEEPYKSYKDRFNVHYVTVISKNDVFYGETALSTYYGEGTQVGGDDDKVIQYALKAISMDQMDDALIIVMMNRDYYAGTCYMYYGVSDGDYGRGLSIAYFPTSSDEATFNGLVSHEAGGHGFAKLADEYAYEGSISDAEVNEYRAQEQYGWWKNVDFTSDPSMVKWATFIEDDRYTTEGVGVFEGACTYAEGAWRPTENSIMRYNIGGFNAPSRYAIWYKIHKLAYGVDWNGTYEDFVAYDAVNRQQPTAASRHRSYVEKQLPPLAPPVVVSRDWRDAIK